MFCFSDSSFANLGDSKSQCGYIVGLSDEKIYTGKEAHLFVTEAYSGGIKRVCRSTLAAESNGFLAGAEAAEYMRALLMELVHPGVPLRDLDDFYLKKKIIAFTDARSLEQTLNKDAGQPSDKRVKIRRPDQRTSR